MPLVVTLGGCSRRTQQSSSLDWSPTYTTFTVAVLLIHDHMSFQNVLWSLDLCHMTLVPTLSISQPHCMCHSCTMDQQSHTIWFTTTPKGQHQQGYLLMRVQLFMQFFEQVFCYTSMSLFSNHFFVTVRLEVLDQVFKCLGNYSLFRALITQLQRSVLFPDE